MNSRNLKWSGIYLTRNWTMRWQFALSKLLLDISSCWRTGLLVCVNFLPLPTPTRTQLKLKRKDKGQVNGLRRKCWTMNGLKDPVTRKSTCKQPHLGERRKTWTAEVLTYILPPWRGGPVEAWQVAECVAGAESLKRPVSVKEADTFRTKVQWILVSWGRRNLAATQDSPVELTLKLLPAIFRGPRRRYRGNDALSSRELPQPRWPSSSGHDWDHAPTLGRKQRELRDRPLRPGECVCCRFVPDLG